MKGWVFIKLPYCNVSHVQVRTVHIIEHQHVESGHAALFPVELQVHNNSEKVLIAGEAIWSVTSVRPLKANRFKSSTKHIREESK